MKPLTKSRSYYDVRFYCKLTDIVNFIVYVVVLNSPYGSVRAFAAVTDEASMLATRPDL